MTVAAEPLIEARGLRVERGGVRVLDVPAFTLHDGEFVSLIGPNGAGKSTLLLSMMCLLGRTSGQVRYRGREVATRRDALELRRRVALVQQEPLLFDATVQENVASGLEFRGVPRAERRRRVQECLGRLGLRHLAGRSARKLSGGEARRVSLARALAVEPEAIFLDEPFVNLDPPTRQSITADLESTIREKRMAVVLVTHEQAEALRLSDRIAVMNGGAILQADSPSVVMNSPADVFVAGWVGMETILEGVIARREDGLLRVDVDGGALHAVGEDQPGRRVYCCIRPENVTIDVEDPTGTTSARNVFRGRIAAVSSSGMFLKVSLDCAFPLIAYVTREAFTGLDLDRRTDVFASFKATAVHVVGRWGAGEPRQAQGGE